MRQFSCLLLNWRNVRACGDLCDVISKAIYNTVEQREGADEFGRGLAKVDHFWTEHCVGVRGDGGGTACSCIHLSLSKFTSAVTTVELMVSCKRVTEFLAVWLFRFGRLKNRY